MAWFGIADPHVGWFGREGHFPRYRVIGPHDKLEEVAQIPIVSASIGITCVSFFILETY